MAEGASSVANDSINKKPATEHVWDIKLFENQVFAANLACINCGHPPKKCFMDEAHQTLCKLCSEALIEKDIKITENPVVDGLIAKAVILCPNTLCDPKKNNNDDEKKENENEIKKECDWKGLVKDWANHNDKECQYTKVNCNDCCEYWSSRLLQEAHHGVCGFAVIKCPLSCNDDILRKDTKDHTENRCSHTILKCTNDECKEEIKRELFHKHVTDLCCKRIVECKYNEYGCNQTKIKHEAMEQHMKQFEIQHIQFQLNTLYQLMHKNMSCHTTKEELQKPSVSRNECESGMIRMFSGKMIPNGWTLCDGKYGAPNLSDKFVLKNGGQTTKGKMDDDDDEEFEISEIDEDELDEDEEESNDNGHYKNSRISSVYSMVYIMKI